MNKFNVIVFGLLVPLCCACHKDMAFEAVHSDAALNVSISGVSSYVSVDTKATPSQLDIPVAEQFNVKIVRNSNGAVILDAPFSKDLFPVNVVSGCEYTITAEYGGNTVLGLNKPYYVGSVVESVQKGQTKDITVPCSVGNSLISVRFGSTQEDNLRFEKYFEDCAVAVIVGDNMVYLPFSNPNVSAYLRAGSGFRLNFSGVLRSSDQTRSFDLPEDMLPPSLSPAEHLVVTLDIKAESGLDITITKAEIENTELDQSVPYEWLPLPSITANHRFDANGILVGTDLSCTASYPGCTWSAYVRNSAGTLVRTLTGEGALGSAYSSSSSWPYLPSGSYTATVSYQYNGKTINVEGRSRTFTVAPPAGIKTSVTGYTSYDKYLSGDVTGANQCNAFTLYGITVDTKVSAAIKANANYSHLFSAVSGSVWVDDNTGKKSFAGSSAGNISSLKAGSHNCSVNCTFDGASSTSSFSFLVTGLPVSFSPPTEGAGWSGHGTVKFNSDNVQLGRYAWSQPHYIDYSNISVPMGTKVKASYDVNPHGATVQTTLSLYFGDYEYFSKKSSYMSDSRESGSKVFMAGSNVNYLKANSSYGSGETRSYVYSLSYEYAQ